MSNENSVVYNWLVTYYFIADLKKGGAEICTRGFLMRSDAEKFIFNMRESGWAAELGSI